MSNSNVPPREVNRGNNSKPATARLSLDGTKIYPNENEKLPSLNRLNNPNVAVDSFADKNSARLVNTNQGLFSGRENSANAAIGVGVNAKAVTFTIGSVISNELLQSVEEKRANLFDANDEFLTDVAEYVERSIEQKSENDRVDGITANWYDEALPDEDNSTTDSTQEANPILPRFFEDRSYLIFYSPEVKFVMPFFENPIISEKRMSTYATFNQTGLSPLVTFQYANLAEIKINFKLNFLHIADILKKENLDINAYSFFSKTDFTESISEVSKFFDRSQGQTSTNSFDPLGVYKNILIQEEDEFLEKIDNYTNSFDLAKFKAITQINANIRGNQYDFSSDNIIKTQALCMMWLYVIKAWVYGSATTDIKSLLAEIDKSLALNLTQSNSNQITSKYIIIKHGPIFYYIPGILTSYEIKEVTNTPYDIHTLMAYGYDVSLSIIGRPENYDKVKNSLGLIPKEVPSSR